MMFAALSGSSPATVVAIGSIVIAAMRQVGYSKEFAAGVICNAGTLGILIPPSIVMVVYASATDVSVGRMFLAGVIPGLLAGFMLMVTIYVIAEVKNLPKGEWQGWGEVCDSFPRRGLGPVADRHHPGRHLRLGITGRSSPRPRLPRSRRSMRSSSPVSSTATWGRWRARTASATAACCERAAVRCVTAFFHRDVRNTLFEAGKLTIMLMFIIANALILKHVLTDEQIPQQIAGAMLDAGFGPIMFLIVVNVILLIGGQFMEPSGLIVIVAPLVFPIAIELGIDPIHLGIIMVVNMEIGMITPPVGLNLFVTSGVAGMPMMAVVRAALPFLAVLFVFLIMVTYIPFISTWLPTLMMGPEDHQVKLV